MLGRTFSSLQQRFGHWTAQYAVDRVRLELFQRTHPKAPWFVPSAIRLLESGLRSSDVVLEFGSGRSTSWLAERAERVISVEHDANWHASVAGTLRQVGLTNVQQRLVDPSDYLSVFGELGPESVDVVINDGIKRDQVALESLSRLSPGGLLVIDDAGRYLPRDGAERAKTGFPKPRRDYASEAWQAFGEQSRDWRRVWFSSGVTDTVIFVKASAGVVSGPDLRGVV
jgi:predicted O-methyltransferase YrrM